MFKYVGQVAPFSGRTSVLYCTSDSCFPPPKNGLSWSHSVAKAPNKQLVSNPS